MKNKEFCGYLMKASNQKETKGNKEQPTMGAVEGRKMLQQLCLIFAFIKGIKEELNLIDESLTILSILASHQEAKSAIVKASTIPLLIDLTTTGPSRNKENATSILLFLCKRERLS